MVKAVLATLDIPSMMIGPTAFWCPGHKGVHALPPHLLTVNFRTMAVALELI